MPLDEAQAIGVYKRSKVAAERPVESDDRAGLPAVIVNPSTPIGPRDVKPTPTGRIIFEAAAGRMPAFVDTGLNMVHVDDVAAGHLSALERGAYRRALYSRRAERVAREILVNRRRRGRPQAAAKSESRAARLSGRLIGGSDRALSPAREPCSRHDGLKMSKNKMFFTSAKAERELGYRARPYAEGVRDAIAWFRQAGYLKS